MIQSRVSGVRKAVGRLRWYDFREAGQAQIALLRALARVRTRPIGTLVAPFSGRQVSGGAPEGSVTPSASSVDEGNVRRAAIRRLELAVARAARRGLFRPTCLVRSLALADLLARHGVAGAEIRIGVRQPCVAGTSTLTSLAQLEAHAWVELDGMVLGDDYRRAYSFTPLGGVRVVQPPTDRPS